MDRCAKVGKPSSFAFSCRSSLRKVESPTLYPAAGSIQYRAAQRTSAQNAAVLQGGPAHRVRSMMGPLSMSPSEKLEARVRNARYVSSRNALESKTCPSQAGFDGKICG
jgi:hypothetical protein